jgi:DNA primase
MARIAEAELERLKGDVALERLAESRGVELKKVGKDLRGRCPFHGPDNDPSLSIDPVRNLFHCFGCGAKGGPVDWVMKAEAVSFRHAVELLRHQAIGAPASPRAGKGGRGRTAEIAEASPVKHATVRRLPPPVALDAGDEQLLEQVVAYYEQTYREEEAAQGYLRDRGIGDPAFAEAFRIGFANRTLGLRLPNKQRLAGEQLRARLQKLGILRESGHEHFNGCVVFPTDDEQGRVVGLYGRKITPGLKPEIPRHLYLPGPRRGVWNWRGLVDQEEAILCESHVDAATFWCAGYRHVTTAWGAGGLTEEHVEAFRRFGIRRVLVAFDRDDAGDKGAREAAERLGAAGIGCYRVQFPRGLDANDYGAKVTPASKSLGLVLRHAQWMGPGEAPVAHGVDAGGHERRDTGAAASESATVADAAAIEPSPAPATPPPPARSLPPLASSPSPPLPSSSTSTVPAEVRDQEVVIRLGDRRYRVRGLDKAMSYDSLRVNLLAARGDAFFVDTLELYSARHRAAFIRAAAEELSLEEAVVKHDVGKVFAKLEELQEQQIQRTLTPQPKTVTIEPAARDAALELLRDPELLSRIEEDLTRCGLVGEPTNKLVAYLACVSRKLEKPLAVLVQSSSAAGKSTLMETVLSLVPEEERVAYSAMTGQALFYMSEQDLRHKVLAIAEEEGAERASYALKLLQSEGKLSIASTGKDPATGRLVTQEYRVEGPVSILSTTTAIDLDPEFLNRCLVLAVDESREQTRAIHRYQRFERTLDGYLQRRSRDQVRELHRNAQRLLEPLPVINPFGQELSFLDENTRTRRDHAKYLALIEAIALLFQHQRPRRRHPQGFDYIEVAAGDIALANRVAAEVLGRTLDELPPQTRRLLDLVDAMVTAECARLAIDRTDYRFGRRDVAAATGWSYPQVRAHLDRLVDYEYLVVHRGGRGQSFVYELLYDGSGKDGQPFLVGLIDVAQLGLHTATTVTLRGSAAGFDPSLRGHSPPIEAGLRGHRNGSAINNDKVLRSAARNGAGNSHLDEEDEKPRRSRTDELPSLVASGLRSDAE